MSFDHTKFDIYFNNFIHFASNSTGCLVKLEKFGVTRLALTLLVLMSFCIRAMVEKEIRLIRFYLITLIFYDQTSHFSSGPISLRQNSFIISHLIDAWQSAVIIRSFWWKIAVHIVKLRSGTLRTMTPASWANSTNEHRHFRASSGNFQRIERVTWLW